MLASWTPGLWLLGLWATFSHGANIGELTQTCIWLLSFWGLCTYVTMYISVIWAFMGKCRS